MFSGIEYIKKKKNKMINCDMVNNHNDDDVKGHTWQKYAIVRPYGNNIDWTKWKTKNINILFEKVSQNIDWNV